MGVLVRGIEMSWLVSIDPYHTERSTELDHYDIERYRPKKSQNQNQYNHVDSTGRYGIGMAFQQDVQVPGTSAVVSDGNIMVSPQGTTTPIYTPPAYPTPLRCDLCGVSANRQDQLETHKRGARHMRMLRLNGLPIPELRTRHFFHLAFFPFVRNIERKHVHLFPLFLFLFSFWKWKRFEFVRSHRLFHLQNTLG